MRGRRRQGGAKARAHGCNDDCNEDAIVVTSQGGPGRGAGEGERARAHDCDNDCDDNVVTVSLLLLSSHHRASRGQGEARVRQCERRSAQNHDDNCNNDMIVAASLSSRCRASKGKEVVIVVAIRRDGGRE